MGHAFQDTIMDTLIRHHRMKGDNKLRQPGTDHADIATGNALNPSLICNEPLTTRPNAAIYSISIHH
jgi:valyl-tRNA synthetase